MPNQKPVCHIVEREEVASTATVKPSYLKKVLLHHLPGGPLAGTDAGKNYLSY